MGLYKRGKVWWMSFTCQGRRYRKPTETDDKEEAQEILDDVKYKIRHSELFETDLGETKSFKEMMERYLKEHVSKKKSQRAYRGYVHNLEAFFDDYNLSEVTPELIDRYKEQRLRSGVKPATVNRDLAILKNAFNRAIYKWNPPWFKEENPMKRVEMEKENNKRTRWLTYEEEAKLKKVSPQWLWEISLIAMETGLRQNELLSLTWPMVDLKLKTIVVLETKNGEPKVVPLSNTALEVLRNRPRSLKTDLVFYTSGHTKYSGRNVDRALAITLAKAEIKNFKFHDFRHTCATRLVQAGEDLYKVQKYLGHLSGETTKRYAHHSVESLRGVAESLDRSRQDRCHNFVTVSGNRKFVDSQVVEIKEKAHVAQR
jgi:integrase